MYRPSLPEVQALARQTDANLVSVYRDVPADLETPVSAYLKVARGDHSFLLEVLVQKLPGVHLFAFVGLLNARDLTATCEQQNG